MRFSRLFLGLFLSGVCAPTSAVAVPEPSWNWPVFSHHASRGLEHKRSYDLKKAHLPLCSGPSQCLSAPPSSSHLKLILLGVGTQNFTCSTSSTPTSNGAKAILYDISHLASFESGSALSYIPKLSMLARSTAATTGAAAVPASLGYPEVGRHFFGGGSNAPTFKVIANGKNLSFVGKKLEEIVPPSNALPMSANWLKLGLADGMVGKDGSKGVKFVYRIHVAGGKPSADICQGKTAGQEVTVPYATQYWLFD